jgi:hypothetical protein
LELIALINPSWNQLWDKLDAMLPQSEPDINEADIMSEVKAFRQSKKSGGASLIPMILSAVGCF